MLHSEETCHSYEDDTLEADRLSQQKSHIGVVCIYLHFAEDFCAT